MPTRQRLVTYGLTTTAAATVTVCALLQPWRGPDEPPVARRIDVPRQVPVANNRHAVDVVFAVDTTASMDGLIDSAKRTVWSIATHIRKTDPDADLRIGLIAYRDIGDDYVTSDLALTTDLDGVFARLSSLRAAGGGDVPEDVDAALDDAVHRMAWRDGASKMVFLVGDAPPASRGDVPSFDVTAREAGERGIVINTIRCGYDRDTEAAWRRIAALGHGQFSTIQHEGGVQQIATPYDDQLARLSATIDDTTVIMGDDGARREYSANMAAAAAAPAPAKAERAKYFTAKGATGAGGSRTKNDLVGGVAEGSVHLDQVAPGDLPADLRTLDRPALEAEVKRRGAERTAAQGELDKLVQQRDEYLKAHVKDADAGFDAKVMDAIDSQLKH